MVLLKQVHKDQKWLRDTTLNCETMSGQQKSMKFGSQYFYEAMNLKEWNKAIRQEINAIERNNTQDLINQPKKINPLY